VLAISCSSCAHVIPIPGDRLPPWCPHCGNDVKRDTQPMEVPDPPPSPAPPRLLPGLLGARRAPAFVPSSLPAPVPQAIASARNAPLPTLDGPAPEGLAPELAEGSVPNVKPPVPGWVVPFLVGCGVIPLVTLGGALPVLIAVGGISGCLSIARKESLDLVVRVGACAAILVACWLTLFAAIGSVALLLQQV
jgi:hypothetical protein